ncbi:hypothetical protein Hanom_Chr01g00047971 [Helianthus anomalus]
MMFTMLSSNNALSSDFSHFPICISSNIPASPNAIADVINGWISISASPIMSSAENVNDVPTTVTPGAVAKVDYSTAANPLALPICVETRPPPARKHDSEIIGKTSPPIQVEMAPPVFALHLDAAENNEESGNRTWVTRNANSFPNHSTATSFTIVFV